MNIEDIRSTFSKGGIVISSGGIMVFYAYKERWLTQSVDDVGGGVFYSILKMADKLNIIYVPGKLFELVFHKDFGEQEMVFYAPLEQEVSLQELKSILWESHNEEVSKEFYDFTKDVDFKDKDEVFERINEYITLKFQEENSEEFDASDTYQWQDFLYNVLGFSEHLGFECSVLEPDEGFNGSVTIYFPKSFRSVEISGEIKDEFENIIAMCECFTIECNINEGFLNLIFHL